MVSANTVSMYTTSQHHDINCNSVRFNLHKFSICRSHRCPADKNNRIGKILMVIMCKWEQSTGDGTSTLSLNFMGRVKQNLKQRVQVAPQNGDLSPQKKEPSKQQKVQYVWDVSENSVGVFFFGDDWDPVQLISSD